MTEEVKKKRGRKPKNQNTTQVLEAPEVSESQAAEIAETVDEKVNDAASNSLGSEFSPQGDDSANAETPPSGDNEKPADVVGKVSLTVDPATFLKISNAFGKKPEEPIFKAKVDVGTLPVETAKKVVAEKKAEFKERDLVKEAEAEAKRLAWYRGGPRV